jgi:hypothetical protein
VPDFETTTEGDFVLANGTITEAGESQSVFQDIVFRLRTGQFDFSPDLDFGAGLDRFRGEPNNRSTGGRVEQAVIQALTVDGKFTADSFAVQVVPIDVHTLKGFLFVNPRLVSVVSPLKITFTIDLNVGDITQITGILE